MRGFGSALFSFKDIMIFIQEQSILDADHDLTTFRIAISDNYADLFKKNDELTSFISTSIIEFDSSKKDLNTDDNKFAVDELDFSINSYNCETENDKNCLAFVLGSGDINVARYFAFFIINESDANLTLLENFEFIGKISDKIKGKEVAWLKPNTVNPRLEYSPDTEALVEFSFSALSIDISLLDDCKCTEKIVDKDGGKILNIYDRFKGTDGLWTDANAIYAVRQHMKTANHWINFYPMANLFDILQKMLDYSTEIVNAKYNTVLNFKLSDSFFNFSTAPFIGGYYEISGYNDFPILYNTIELTQSLINIGIIKTETENLDTKKSSVYMHRDWLTPDYKESLNNWTDNENKPINDPASNKFCILNLGSVSEILFSIAKAFGCYIKSTQIVENGIYTIYLEFVSRSQLNASEIFIQDATDSGIDVASTVSTTASQFYGQGTLFTSDSSNVGDVPNDNDFDYLCLGVPSLKFFNSDRLNKATDYRTNLKDKKSVESQILSISTSPVLGRLKDGENINANTEEVPFIPLTYTNIFGENMPTPNGMIIYLDVKADRTFAYCSDKINDKLMELPTTAFFISYKSDLLNDQPVLAPPPTGEKCFAYASRIYTNVDSIPTVFNSLSNYVNSISGTDVQFYKSERDITIPNFNGFKLNDNSSWKNLTLGSIVTINKPSKIYSNGNFVNGTSTETLVVVGIERKIKEFQTTIKLQSVSRFAYGEWSGEPQANALRPIVPITNDITGEYYKLSDDLNAGDVVMLENDGTVKKLVCISANKKKRIGIILENGVINDFKRVVFDGSANIDSLSLNADGIVYARNTGISQTSINIGTTPQNTDANDNENLFVILGKADSPASIFLDVKKFTVNPKFYYVEPM